jgi:biopolymer transport protein ExbD
VSIKFDGDGDSEDIVAEINMTPLIDVMLVLLIIFMVTSSITVGSGLDVHLPECASTDVQTSEPKAVFVAVDKNGVIAVQGKRVSLENLASIVKDELAKAKTDFVIFEGDRGSNLGVAVQVMDLAKSAGAKRFAIATDERK